MEFFDSDAYKEFMELRRSQGWKAISNEDEWVDEGGKPSDIDYICQNDLC